MLRQRKQSRLILQNPVRFLSNPVHFVALGHIVLEREQESEGDKRGDKGRVLGVREAAEHAEAGCGVECAEPSVLENRKGEVKTGSSIGGVGLKWHSSSVLTTEVSRATTPTKKPPDSFSSQCRRYPEFSQVDAEQGFPDTNLKLSRAMASCVAICISLCFNIIARWLSIIDF